MQDDAAVLQVLVGERFPVNLPHSSGSGSTRNSDRWIELHENQRLGTSPLHQSTPLLPKCVLSRILVRVRNFPWLQSLFVEGGLIHLDISPCTGGTAESDRPLDFENVGLANEC